MAQLKCIVVTPEETALETTADFVALPLFDGEIGIAPSHSPMIGRLGFGEMRIKSGGTTTTYYIDGGFVQVANNEVNVLTSKAMPADELSREAAEKQLTEAMKQPATTDELTAIRDRMVEQARAQIRMSKN
ncbi:ATP synthase F1 subunit epsilon [Blastopirellula sp. JC732]|uniref:ATP synthase epsilon chain n=1 Tax=Blastopirellula sediminis TaxID=2894196 RepID=A0A9X1SIM1_9BACT|nr:ATP synthase F1 subunit epsilon [Blastopirellula sediminis]MCC9605278.1 ATP synthase F1 subunit epsilon [Blastopirellula sediminis]MCC9631422.1 ATP synthase F1 subunit epsilon [Blastopirellula sediminis]